MWRNRFSLVLVLGFFAAQFVAAGNGFAFDINCGYDPGNPLDDTHQLTDTVQALALWTCPDSATWLSFWPDCEQWLPITYDLPTWADSLWDPARPRSVSKFYLDNSAGRHLLTGDSPRSPAGGLWLVPGDLYDGWWDPAYFTAALNFIDDNLDFAQYDHNSDGYVDQLIIYSYHIDGRGATGGYTWQSDDSVDTPGGRVPVRVSGTIGIRFGQFGGYVDFLTCLGLTTHEYGHTFGIADLYGNGISNGPGGFCTQAANGFDNADHTDHEPALHNPMIRTGRYWNSPNGTPWINSTIIGTTQLDYHLQQYAGALYRINPDPTRPSQYFLLSNHLRQTHWDKYYPAQGLMIWHADSTYTGGDAYVKRGGRKKLDIEDAGGMWNWTFQNVPDTVFNPGGGCWPSTNIYSRNTGTNTGQPNPASGVDSMDVVYVSGWGEPTAPTYPTNAPGAASTFFKDGSIFGPNSNPNSNLYNGDNQTVSTQVEVQVVRTDSASGFTVAHVIVDGWHGTLSSSASWHDSVNVSGNLTVASGATLTIDTGTVVVMHGNLTVASGGTMNVGAGVVFSVADYDSITVYGTLSAIGHEADSIRFQAAPGLTQWPGIRVFNGGYAIVRYAVIQDAFLPFWANGAGTSTVAMMLLHTRIIGGGNGLRIWGSPTKAHRVQYVTIQDVPNIETYAALYFDNTRVFCEDMDVVNSGYRTGYILNTTGYLTRCYFNGPTANYGLCISGATSGLIFRCCEIDHIAPINYPSASVWCLNQGNPVFGASGNPIYNNRVVDNRTYLVWFSGNGARPVFGGYDNVLVQESYGAGGIFFKWDNYPVGVPTRYNATHIYWGGRTPQARFFDPADAQYWDWNSYLTTDPGLCGEGEGGRGFASAFDSALALETQEQWSEAQAAYLSIAANPDYSVGDRTSAAARAVIVDRETQALSIADVNELASAMEAGAADLRDSLAVERVRLCHATDEASFAEALDGYENLLARELTEEDSLLTVIDIYHVQMLAEGGGGNLDAALEPRNPVYAVHSATEGVRKVNEAMAALMGQTQSRETEPAIPTVYALYQNYPNPFNPITTIRFDLPEAANVQVKVFNTLGQEVATLLDETRAAGAYRVQWDASGVASGLYIYQIKAGNFVDSKKMLLLK